MNSFKTPKGTQLPFLNLKGKDYLLVAHRIVWFREQHPDWAIQTTIVKFEHDYALVSAEILNNEGKVLATAHKMQTAKGFPGGFLEKAESAAVGRALAFLGFGTAFAQELEEDESTPISSLADSPLSQSILVPYGEADKIQKVFPSAKITDQQAKRMFAIARAKGWQPEQVKVQLKKLGFTDSKDLDRKNYDTLINILEQGPEGDFNA